MTYQMTPNDRARWAEMEPLVDAAAKFLASTGLSLSVTRSGWSVVDAKTGVRLYGPDFSRRVEAWLRGVLRAGQMQPRPNCIALERCLFTDLKRRISDTPVVTDGRRTVDRVVLAEVEDGRWRRDVVIQVERVTLARERTAGYYLDAWRFGEPIRSTFTPVNVTPGARLALYGRWRVDRLTFERDGGTLTVLFTLGELYEMRDDDDDDWPPVYGYDGDL